MTILVPRVHKSNPEMVDCCALYLLANKPDFLSDHELIQQEIEKPGYKVIIKIVLPHLANENVYSLLIKCLILTQCETESLLTINNKSLP
ncbi:4720_t:CDS:2 [Gigaspora rosea]|nr:4720_t:CDS:2 [Gigaspora rosea]